MSSSNSFNICPRCGNSNSLNAKYCSRCGAQMKVPTEAVVCHKCHTRNSALANFCRNCGATLKVGAQTKICPRCGREIGAEENMCACGYSFVTLQQAEPRRADVSSTNKDRKKDKKRGKESRVQEQNYAPAQNNAAPQEQGGQKSKQKKGGRGFAIFALILIAVFAYAIISQTSLHGPLGKIDKGYFYNPNVNYGENSGDKDVIAVTTTNEQGEESTVYVKYYSGYSLLKDVFDLLTEKKSNADNVENLEDLAKVQPTMFDYYTLANSDPDSQISKFEFFKQMYGWGAVVMIALIALFLFTSLLHVLSCIIRLISPKRSKRGNWLYLTLAIVTTLVVGATLISAHSFADKTGFLATVYSFLVPCVTIGDGLVQYFWVGFAAAYVPIAYWLLWLYSCIAKRKTPKKEKKSKKNA